MVTVNFEFDVHCDTNWLGEHVLHILVSERAVEVLEAERQ